MKWHVYIIRCADGSLYTGVTTDVARRLAAHAAGKGSRIVRSKLPFKLVYRRAFKSRSAALKREAEIKGWPRSKKIQFLKTSVYNPSSPCKFPSLTSSAS